MTVEEVLRYGEIIFKQDNISTEGVFTIRIIRVEGKLYGHKMKNGEVIEIEKL